MENRRSTGSTDTVSRLQVFPIQWFENHTRSLFRLAGVLLAGSLIVPIGLDTFSDWAWVSGIVLVGLAILAVATGLLGFYPRVTDHAARLALVGVLGAVVSGGAALALIAMGAVAFLGEAVFGLDLGKPVGIFVAVSLSMAGGFALGFLSFGAAGQRTGKIPKTTSQLLLLGGALLLVPVASEALRRGFGVEIGVPPWVFLPVLGLVTLDVLAIGQSLRTES